MEKRFGRIGKKRDELKPPAEIEGFVMGDDSADIWSPEDEGETLVGTVTGWDTDAGRNEKVKGRLDILTKDGVSWSVYRNHSLKASMQKAMLLMGFTDPEELVGHEVSILFRGFVQTSPDKSPMRSFAFYIKGQREEGE